MAGKGSSRPSLKYNSIAQRWEVVGKGGSLKTSFGDDGQVINRGPAHIQGVATVNTNLNIGSQAVIEQLRVGSGSSLDFVLRAVATLTQALTIGSGFAVVEGTLQSATGSGISVAGLNVGDFVFGAPKIALDSAELHYLRIPTTNTLVAGFSTRDQAAGSLAAGAGFDILAVR